MILFDAVGTLIRPERPVAAIYRRVGLRFGVDIEEAEIEQRFSEAFDREDLHDERELEFRTSETREHERWRSIVEQVFHQSDQRGEIFSELWTEFGRAETWRLFEEVTETLIGLSERGYRLGVASNFDRRLRAVMAGHVGLAALERCFISSEVGYRKPSPRFFEAVQAQLGLPPEAILMVGDDYENDLVAGRASGWRAVLVDRGGARVGEDVVSAISELGFLI